MKLVTWIRTCATALLVAVLGSGCSPEQADVAAGAGGSDAPPIGRMKVSIMPEYDDASVLVIYEGRFEDAARYPIRASFLVPRGSIVNDACSLSVEGRHFCQLYQTFDRGGEDEVRMLLPYPSYYLSFHTPPLDLAIGDKSIDYRIRPRHPVKRMEVDIQQPLRSTEFRVLAPAAGAGAGEQASTTVVDGFNHLLYRLDEVAANEPKVFQIRYRKTDPTPSVNVKYASMRESQIASAPYDAQRSVRTIVYALFGTGALGALALAAWILRARRARRRAAS